MIVNGFDIPESDLSSALRSFGSDGFSLRELQAVLEAEGVSQEVSYEGAKRLLQRERKTGALIHDVASGEWKRAETKTASAPSAESEPRCGAGTPIHTLPLEPVVGSLPHRPINADHRNNSLAERLWIAAAFAACASAVFALALINASFAWQVAETDSFRVAFVMGLAASDLMRPLLVAQGLWEFERQRLMRGFAAITIALSLTPVSIISCTAVVSGALYLGAEENDARQDQDIVRMTLQAEYNRLTALSKKAWLAWEIECARGGCREEAAELEATAKELEFEARKRFDAMLEISENSPKHSSFLSRTVTTFQQNGFFGLSAIIAIPLLIALSLEIAALFGPGILLSRQRE